MRKVTAIALILAGLTLTGCETFTETDMRVGMECRDAGGVWKQAEGKESRTACFFLENERTKGDQ